MQSINKVILQGIVGNIRIRDFKDTKVANISLATEYCYKKDTEVISETTWHNVVVWQYMTDINLMDLKKGDNVYVEGRIRKMKYINAEGNDVMYIEIIASEFRYAKQE